VLAQALLAQCCVLLLALSVQSMLSSNLSFSAVIGSHSQLYWQRCRQHPPRPSHGVDATAAVGSASTQAGPLGSGSGSGEPNGERGERADFGVTGPEVSSACRVAGCRLVYARSNNGSARALQYSGTIQRHAVARPDGPGGVDALLQAVR
jgi:hypothetical protein